MTFNKRRKELARKERQADKRSRRDERRLKTGAPETETSLVDIIALAENGGTPPDGDDLEDLPSDPAEPETGNSDTPKPEPPSP